MRGEQPSRRWYLRWRRSFKASGGHDGPKTLDALWPYAVQLYGLGSTALAAGAACARQYHTHGSMKQEQERGDYFSHIARRLWLKQETKEPIWDTHTKESTHHD